MSRSIDCSRKDDQIGVRRELGPARASAPPVLGFHQRFVVESLRKRDPHVTGNYDIRDYTADVAFPEGKNVFALTAGMTAVSHDPNILRDTLLGNRMHFVTSGLFGNPSGDMTPNRIPC